MSTVSITGKVPTAGWRTRKSISTAARRATTDEGNDVKVRTRTVYFRWITIGAAFAVAFFIAFLLFYIVTFAGFSNFLAALTSRETLFSLRMSLMTASLSTLLCVITGIPAAYALARYRFPGKTVVNTIIDIPLALPSLVVGFGLLIFFGTTPIGDMLKNMGLVFVFTPLGIIIAQYTVNISSMIRIMKATFSSINPRYENVARTLGCSRLKAASRILLPMARQGLVAAIMITWSRAIGEFGAVIMIAGSTRMKTETLPVSLFLNLNTGDLEAAAAAASILIAISIISLVVFEKYFKGKALY
ncbi:MAG: ABC transporter permease subunit [bacterium]|nr:ABC transporter permease subunit [bacterium]